MRFRMEQNWNKFRMTWEIDDDLEAMILIAIHLYSNLMEGKSQLLNQLGSLVIQIANYILMMLY